MAFQLSELFEKLRRIEGDVKISQEKGRKNKERMLLPYLRWQVRLLLEL